MKAIHLIERMNNCRLLNKATHEWESGWWKVSTETAEKLVGGNLYLHAHQNSPSHFGGFILGFRVEEENRADKGRIIFHIRFTPESRGVVTDRNGWGMEKKIVLE
ncbi:hypothetical protein HUU62_20095 [Rhodoferax sp. 4810]|nr:hypothetical protein [Rhodoferax jenense]